MEITSYFTFSMLVKQLHYDISVQKLLSSSNSRVCLPFYSIYIDGGTVCPRHRCILIALGQTRSVTPIFYLPSALLIH